MPSSWPCLCPDGGRCPLPGAPNRGTGIFADRSLEVFKSVANFVERHGDESGESGAFVVRLALKPTLVLTSNAAVKSFLEDTDPAHFYNGMKDFFFGLFGHSILFADAAEASQLRTILLPLFDSEAVARCPQGLRSSSRISS